jgi:small subunit ribosomal protein S6
MRTPKTANYEAMFLFPQAALADLKSAVAQIKDPLAKAGAEIIALKKWGDRPLTYPIKKQKRGVYILCYFSVTTDKLAAMERHFTLSEHLLRYLITRADHLSREEMLNADAQLDLTIEANLKAQPIETATAAPAAAAPAENA